MGGASRGTWGDGSSRPLRPWLTDPSAAAEGPAHLRGNLGRWLPPDPRHPRGVPADGLGRLQLRGHARDGGWLDAEGGGELDLGARPLRVQLQEKELLVRVQAEVGKGQRGGRRCGGERSSWR